MLNSGIPPTGALGETRDWCGSPGERARLGDPAEAWDGICKSLLNPPRDADWMSWTRAALDNNLVLARCAGEPPAPNPADWVWPGNKQLTLTYGASDLLALPMIRPTCDDGPPRTTLPDVILRAIGRRLHLQWRPNVCRLARPTISTHNASCCVGQGKGVGWTVQGLEGANGPGLCRSIAKRMLPSFRQTRRRRCTTSVRRRQS
jgi:hypothetical protein